VLVKITELAERCQVQIRVGKPQSNAQPVQTYSSLEHARRVVLEFGIEPVQVDATLNLFPKIAPNHSNSRH
jgi:hypothetical protein